MVNFWVFHYGNFGSCGSHIIGLRGGIGPCKQSKYFLHGQVFVQSMTHVEHHEWCFLRVQLTTLSFLCRMVIKWRKREHDDVDRVVNGNLVSQQALQRCGFYKLWNIGSMREQSILLQILINYWDSETTAFNLDGMSQNRGGRYIFHHRIISPRWDSQP